MGQNPILHCILKQGAPVSDFVCFLCTQPHYLACNLCCVVVARLLILDLCINKEFNVS